VFPIYFTRQSYVWDWSKCTAGRAGYSVGKFMLLFRYYVFQWPGNTCGCRLDGWKNAWTPLVGRREPPKTRIVNMTFSIKYSYFVKIVNTKTATLVIFRRYVTCFLYISHVNRTSEIVWNARLAPGGIPSANLRYYFVISCFSDQGIHAVAA